MQSLWCFGHCSLFCCFLGYGSIVTCFLIMLMYTIVPGRVRVSVRLRPQNTEEMMADADFADCVELQPEVHFGLLFVDSAF